MRNLRLRALFALPLVLAVAASGSAAATVTDTVPPSASRVIVQLRDDVSPAVLADTYAAFPDVRIDHVYTAALAGFAGVFPTDVLAALRLDPRVQAVEADGPVALASAAPASSWGLDRVDQRNLPLSGTYAAQSGAGVTAYVLDTGIRSTHVEFEGRVKAGFDAFGGTSEDCHGHGTHVAGTVGGRTYGVAPGVSLVAVRVLDCTGTGSWSGVIAGVDWVTKHHKSGPAVANMSLSGWPNAVLDDAVRRSIAHGVVYAAASGNAGKDACGYSPARVAEVLTVTALDRYDRDAGWGNYGPCVDLYAPGVQIMSAWGTSDTLAVLQTGTSMAAPHAAGVAALHYAANPGATARDVSDAVNANATTGRVVTPWVVRFTPNRIVYAPLPGTATYEADTPLAGAVQ